MTQIAYKKWLKEHRDLYTSVVVLYEIESGLLHGRMPKLVETFHKLIRMAPVEVLDVTWEISSLAAHMRSEWLSSGITLHAQDLLIGATAKHHGLTIVTDEVKDFQCWSSSGIPFYRDNTNF